jgi:hypothetical protein
VIAAPRNRAHSDDVREGVTRPGMTVVISGDRIAAVGPSGSVEVPGDGRVVDGTGPDVLRIATLVPAQVMDEARDYGSIAAGKVADIIIVDGDPTVRIADLRYGDIPLGARDWKPRWRLPDRALRKELEAHDAEVGVVREDSASARAKRSGPIHSRSSAPGPFSRSSSRRAASAPALALASVHDSSIT